MPACFGVQDWIWSRVTKYMCSSLTPHLLSALDPGSRVVLAALRATSLRLSNPDERHTCVVLPEHVASRHTPACFGVQDWI